MPLRHLARSFVAGLVLAVLTASTVQAQGEDTYAPGRGIALGSTGLRLGGYLAVDWEKPSGAPASFTFDDLSVFVFGDFGPHVRGFLEFEDSKFWNITDGTSRLAHHPDLERLYLEYLHNDALQLRVGKFLTPVGTWNEIHPDPLTWTVNRPLASYATFPTFLTGVMASGTFALTTGDLDYAVFAQANPCLDCNTNDRETERAAGGRVRWRTSTFEAGIPVMHFIDRVTRDEVTLTGAHAVARRGPLELRGEATVAHVSPSTRQTVTEYAWYAQGVWGLTDHYFLVAQAEQAQSSNNDHWNAWTLGTLVRPRAGVSFKVDYQQRRGYFPVEEAGSGHRVLASFGLLF